MSNQQMEEQAEQREAEILAEELEITVDELETVGYELNELCSDDGHPYSTIVRFLDASQTAILAKISGLSNMSVEVGLNLFDSEEYEGDCEEC